MNSRFVRPCMHRLLLSWSMVPAGYGTSVDCICPWANSVYGFNELECKQEVSLTNSNNVPAHHIFFTLVFSALLTTDDACPQSGSVNWGWALGGWMHCSVISTSTVNSYHIPVDCQHGSPTSALVMSSLQFKDHVYLPVQVPMQLAR